MERVRALLDRDPGDVGLLGGEPLDHPAFFELAEAVTAAGHRLHVATGLHRLDDDLHVRPLGAVNGRYVVTVPAPPEHLAALTGLDPEAHVRALRNLRAFGHPMTVVVPVARANVEHLAATLAWARDDLGALWIHVHAVTGEGPDAPRWRHAPPWSAVARQLEALQRWDGPPARLRLWGVDPLALPLESLDGVVIDVPWAVADRPWQVPPGLARHAPVAAPTPPRLAARRRWLAAPLHQRPGWRGDARSQLDHAVAAVLIRPGEPVIGVIERRRDGVPYLTTAGPYGVAVVGRMADPTRARRFAALCREVYAATQADPPEGLAALRDWVHVLRRSMKPKHDDAPIRMRAEGQ